MNDLLPFIVLGLVSGSIYGLAGIGLVLLQDLRDHESRPRRARGCGGVRLLLAQQDHGLPWPAALLLSVVVFGALLGLALERFARLATRMPAALQISGTVGIILVVQGLVWEWKGRDYILFDQFLPRGTFTVLGAYVSWDQVIIIIVGLAVTLALFVFLRRTRLGFAMRGVVDDPDLLSLSGTSPSAVRRWGWVIGLLLACLSGVLLAPSTSLDAAVLTQLVVQAFGAAAIGAFSSLPLTYVGGLGIGLASAISTKYIDAESPLQGLPPSIPFIVLFVALIVTRRDKLVQRLVVPLRPQAPWQTPLAGRLAFGAAALAFLALVPRFAGVYMASWMLGVAYIVLFLSLGILVKTSNQVSLAHATFAAIGASTFAHFQSWVPWGVALLLTGLVLVPIGAAVAIPAIRVSGVYLALATLGFGIFVQYIFFQTDFMFGANQSAAAINRPNGFQDDESFYYLLLGLAFGISVLMLTLHRTRLGRLLRGLADSRLALATLGLSPNITLTLVFALSAFLAGVFGALFGATVFAVSGASLPWGMSLTWLVLLSIVAGSLPWYAVLAALSFAVIPSYLSGVSFYWFTVLFGAFAILHAMIGAPQAPEWVRRLSIRHAAARQPRRRLPQTAVAPAAVRAVPGPGLAVANLTVRFSGVVAVHDLSLSAPVGRITGLIGPNGAGKTTTFNACSGLVRPSSGSIRLGGHDVTRLPPSRRARRGLGRTFQRMQLFESLTVAENVALGREAGMVGANPFAQIVARPAHRRTIAAASEEALALCGIEHLRFVPVVSLSTGQRRLVELARCLAGRFEVLLLDEPSVGARPPGDGRLRRDPAPGRRRARRRRPARRARHGARDGRLRADPRARFRRPHLRRHARRGGGQRGRPHRLPRRCVPAGGRALGRGTDRPVGSPGGRAVIDQEGGGSMGSRRKMGLLAVAAAAVTAAVLLPGGASGAAKSPARTAAGSPIKIGVECECSVGYLAAAGVETKAGLELWEKAVNAKGGINGHPVQLVTYDDASDPAKALGNMRKLVENDKVVAILDASSNDPAFSKYIESKGVPVIGLYSFNPFTFGVNHYFFPATIAQPGFQFGAAGALKSAGAKKVGIITCVEDPSCAATVGSFKALAKSLGMDLVYTGKAAYAATDYSAQCLAAKQAGADGIYLAATIQVGARVMANCAQQGYKPKFASGGGDPPANILKDPAVEGLLSVVGSFPWDKAYSPAVAQLIAAAKKYDPGLLKERSPNLSLTWFIGRLVEKALKGVTPEDEVTSQTVLDGLYAFKGETVDGLSMAKLTYRKTGPQPITACGFVTKVQNHKVTTFLGLGHAVCATSAQVKASGINAPAGALPPVQYGTHPGRGPSGPAPPTAEGKLPKLTTEEIDAQLEQGGIVRLATIAADGWPSVVPLGFVYRDRKVLLTARARVRWLADIRRDPRVCATIDRNEYPLRKVTIKGRAEIVYEPGDDDEWRDLRLPLRTEDWTGPTRLPDGSEEWNWSEAYTVMTHDEPRALVAIPIDGSELTSWRMPLVGEYLEQNWAGRYFHARPRRSRVTRIGPTPDMWRVVAETGEEQTRQP